MLRDAGARVRRIEHFERSEEIERRYSVVTNEADALDAHADIRSTDTQFAQTIERFKSRNIDVLNGRMNVMATHDAAMIYFEHVADSPKFVKPLPQRMKASAKD
jgi:hypothetical protein